MKKFFMIMLVMIVGLSFAGLASAGDKAAIKSQVDEIVMAIDGGKMAGDFADAAKKEPYYVYILKEDGKVLVHPSLVGENLKEKAQPAYDAVVKATPEGNWVKYEWKGKEKNAYVRKTKSGDIVGSGY
jgi:hypothetical protein